MRKDLIELEDTADLMVSTDYKERFVAEYYQVNIRLVKLKGMVKKWDSGDLDFNPTCPRELYDEQIAAMESYLNCLDKRAKMEGVEVTRLL